MQQMSALPPLPAPQRSPSRRNEKSDGSRLTACWASTTDHAWPGLEVTKHGIAGHHTPEDQPAAIAAAVAAWADGHSLRSAD